jgi:hypothetical protein
MIEVALPMKPMIARDRESNSYDLVVMVLNSILVSKIDKKRGKVKTPLH